MTDVWAKWEGRVVNGAFPLRRFLGNSDHSVVFLTEYPPLDISQAAIKLVPADPQLADGQLARWRTLRSVSHPRLLRLFDSGHCQLGGHPFFFIVMEYADQTLAQVLPQRPLTAHEVRELLPPTLDALEYLHSKQLVQGQLKPTNLLVVGDQLKLASDTIRPAGDALPKNHRMSAYDAPETRDGRSSDAADTFGLGATLIEALTQKVPETTSGQPPSISLPGDITGNFADAILRCLSPDPADRPRLSELRAALEPFEEPQGIRVAVVKRPAVRLDATNLKRPPVIVAGAVLLAILGWLGLRGLSHHSTNPEEASAPQSPPSATTVPASPAPGSQSARPGAASAPVAPAVVRQQLPAVSRSAQASIRGHFKVSVRVNVDRTGNVVSAALQDAGPSKYFARLAVDAAKQWKFTPAESARVWQLQFAFSREKITAQASPKG